MVLITVPPEGGIRDQRLSQQSQDRTQAIWEASSHWLTEAKADKTAVFPDSTVPGHVTTGKVSELDQLCWNSIAIFTNLGLAFFGPKSFNNGICMVVFNNWIVKGFGAKTMVCE
mmetsp:Transcript_1134/g.1720  ORF Transcript_1134/g.1720 Transcript_1134/m.1720 type:complete len:114 (+) Transcript_1134:2855-3196(+)